jgi:hypothetical protein
VAAAGAAWLVGAARLAGAPHATPGIASAAATSAPAASQRGAFRVHARICEQNPPAAGGAMCEKSLGSTRESLDCSALADHDAQSLELAN